VFQYAPVNARSVPFLPQHAILLGCQFLFPFLIGFHDFVGRWGLAVIVGVLVVAVVVTWFVTCEEPQPAASKSRAQETQSKHWFHNDAYV
jgi:hypothetical protein